jgi:hypothetical protein
MVEAIVYAYFAQRRSDGWGVGTARLLFHDDAYSATLDPLAGVAAFARPAAEAGAPFAKTKSRAFGTAAGALVAAGVAHTADAAEAVVGVPIGSDAAAWLDAVVRPRFDARLATLRAVNATGNRHLAIAAACRIGGPATLCMHFMRASPPSPSVTERLRAMDASWVALWAELAGVRGNQPRLLECIGRRVHGPSPDGLGHARARAAEWHPLAHAEGSLAAVPRLSTVARCFRPMMARSPFEAALRALAGPVCPADTAAEGPDAAHDDAAEGDAGPAVAASRLTHRIVGALVGARDALRLKHAAARTERAAALRASAHGARSTAPTDVAQRPHTSASSSRGPPPPSGRVRQGRPHR